MRTCKKRSWFDLNLDHLVSWMNFPKLPRLLWHKHKESSSHFAIADLPPVILLEIFYRLPVTDIIRCKFVCKEWYELLLDPNFFDNYVRNPSHTSLLLCGRLRLNPLLFFLEISKNGNNVQPSMHPIRLRKDVSSFGLNKCHFSLIGSCNGLVCILTHEYYDKKYQKKMMFERLDLTTVCFTNPITGHIVACLPQHTTISNVQYRFGLSHTTRKLKVVGSIGYFEKHYDIFTIGIDVSWRRISMAYSSFSGLDPWADHNVACNGAIHWITEDDLHQRIVCAFDLENEDCHPIACPPQMDLNMDLIVLNNNLCIYSKYSNPFTMWTMKEYGVAESWTKDIILKSRFPYPLCPRHISPVSVLHNGDTIFLAGHEYVFSYDRVEKKCNMIKALDRDQELNIDDVVAYL